MPDGQAHGAGARTEPETVDAATDHVAAVRATLARAGEAVAAVGTEAYDARRDTLDEVAGEAPEAARRVRQALGETRPGLEGPGLLPADLLPAVRTLDDVAARARNLVLDVERMAPDGCALEGVLRSLALAERALDRLVPPYLGLVEALAEGGAAPAVDGPVAAVRATEERADAVVGGLLAEAFADGPTVEALVVRELALAADGVVDGLETVADRLAYLATMAP